MVRKDNTISLICTYLDKMFKTSTELVKISTSDKREPASNTTNGKKENQQISDLS